MPSRGTFECDFLYLAINRPRAVDQVSDEDFEALKLWFKDKSDLSLEATQLDSQAELIDEA